MPYIIKKNVVKGHSPATYKVVGKDNPEHIYAYATRRPHALISAIEIHKKKRSV